MLGRESASCNHAMRNASCPSVAEPTTTSSFAATALRPNNTAPRVIELFVSQFPAGLGSGLRGLLVPAVPSEAASPGWLGLRLGCEYGEARVWFGWLSPAAWAGDCPPPTTGDNRDTPLCAGTALPPPWAATNPGVKANPRTSSLPAIFMVILGVLLPFNGLEADRTAANHRTTW